MSDAPSTVRVTQLPGIAPDPTSTTVEVPMTAEDRRRVRRRIETPAGVTIELALPTGTVLPVGAVLCRVGDVDVVVRAAPETTVEVRPTTLAEAAAVGHLIGNMHRDLVLDGDAIVTLHTAPLERRLREVARDVRVCERPFHGRSAGEHAHG